MLKSLTKRVLGIFSIQFLIKSLLSSSLGLLIIAPPTFALSNSSVVGNLSSSPGFSDPWIC